jgi:hypothetical protein
MTENTSIGQPICGIYCDTQIQEKSGGAQYFLDFLGCVYTYDSKQQNKDFYETFRQVITENVTDLTERLEYIEKLNLFMQIDSDKVVPRDFIEHFVPNDNYKQIFTKSCESKNIELNGFDKDIEYIHTKVKQMRVSFENGFSFSVDTETFSTDVIITSTEGGYTNIKVKSQIKGGI